MKGLKLLALAARMAEPDSGRKVSLVGRREDRIENLEAMSQNNCWGIDGIVEVGEEMRAARDK